MLHLALAAMLVGSPLTASTDRPTEGDKDKAPRTEAPVGIVKASAAAEEAPINDTYSFGREEPTPIKLWVGYAWGRTSETYNAVGDRAPLGQGTVDEVVVQRAFVGAQADFLSLPFARLGVGAQLMMGSNDLTASAAGAGAGVNSIDTGFGLHSVKMFAHARGRALGVHGGYILDLGDDPAEGDPTFTSISDGRDAIFVGASFDYPSEVFRLFGGIDYFMLQDNTERAGPAGTTQSDLLVFNMGTGVRISWVEVGAAAIISTTLGPTVTVAPQQGQSAPGATHVGSLVPYVRLSPPALPVSLSIRGAVNRQYADTGFTIGGARQPASDFGLTVAATFGF